MIQRSRGAVVHKAYSFIKKSRFRRKLKTYKMAFAVMIDLTIAIYLLLIGAYIFASFFILGDFIDKYYNQFFLIEEMALANFWFVLTVLPIRYMIQSFSNPGVIFSSSEYQLSMLPYSRGKIWLLCVLGKWLMRFVGYFLIGTLIVLITPISSQLVAMYLLLFLLMDVIMIIPQWKLYQARLITKTGWLCLLFTINFIGFMMNPPIVGILLIGLLVGVNILLNRTLLQQINWDKVTEISDFKIWNMLLISKASEVKFKRQKKHSIFQNTNTGKKAFIYTEKAIHNRLWKLYLGKNAEPLLQIMGAMLILLFVFLFINELLFHIGLAVVIHIYTTILASFFRDRFEADILHVLPWNLSAYKKTFFKWALIGCIILLIPVGTFLGMNASLWVPFKLLFFCSTFIYIYDVKVDKAIALLGKKSNQFDLAEGIGFLFLIGIGFSGHYPIISLSFILATGLVGGKKLKIN